MELLKFKPDLYIFLHHLLWVMWLPALFIGLYFGNFFIGDCQVLAAVIAVIAVVHLYQVLDRYLTDLELCVAAITETFRGRIIMYITWKDINYARVETVKRWLQPDKHTLVICYGDPANPRFYNYVLSELSDVQRERAIVRLKLHINDFEEIVI